MAKTLSKKMIPAGDGGTQLQAFLAQYHATLQGDSSTEKGHVYWSPAPPGYWILVMRRGKQFQVTFHAADDCPCKII